MEGRVEGWRERREKWRTVNKGEKIMKKQRDHKDRKEKERRKGGWDERKEKSGERRQHSGE